MINYSNFFGQTPLDTLTLNRFYHNLYFVAELNSRNSIVISCDLGMDKKRNNKHYIWIAPFCILKTKLTNSSSIALRVEYFDDPNKVILTQVNGNKGKIFGSSINFDKRIHEKLLLRFEGKHFYSSEKIFNVRKQPNHNNYNFTTALCFQF
jgi:hypothetical protein